MTKDELKKEDIVLRQQYAASINQNGFNGLKRESVVVALHPNRADDSHLHDTILSMAESFGSSEAMNQILATTTRKDLLNDLMELGFPTWLVFGDMDRSFDKAAIENLISNDGKFNSRKIVECGHFLPLEKENELASFILEWSAYKNT